MNEVASQGGIWPSARRLPSLSALLVGAALSCNGPVGLYPDTGTDREAITLNGRVVDFESCASWNRCTAVEGVEVRLRTLPEVASEPTTSPGRFALESPPAREDDLLVTEPLGGFGRFAPTLNPWAAPPAVSDVYGIELHVLPLGNNSEGRPSIVTALAAAPLGDRIDLVGDGGYIGQVLRRDSDGLHAVQEARVEVVLPADWPSHVPAPVVRFIQNVPRYASGDVLYEEGYAATGPFGIFVVPAEGQSAVLTIRVHAQDTIFTEVVAPVVPGMVTLGIHTP